MLNCGVQLRDAWTRHKAYRVHKEEDIRLSFENEENRAHRYKKYFEAFMEKKWKEQNGESPPVSLCLHVCLCCMCYVFVSVCVFVCLFQSLSLHVLFVCLSVCLFASPCLSV